MPQYRLERKTGTLSPPEHPLGGEMPYHSLSRYDGMKVFEVQFCPQRTLNAISAKAPGHDFSLAPFPMGVVHPSLRYQCKLGPIAEFGADFDGGPDNAGKAGACALHGMLPSMMPSKFDPHSDAREHGDRDCIWLAGTYLFANLAVGPAVSIDVVLEREVGLLRSDTDEELAYYYADEWTARRDSYIMLIGHPCLKVPPGCRIYIPAGSMQARDPDADAGLSMWNAPRDLGEPVPERCYYFGDLKTIEGRFHMLITNADETQGVVVRYLMDDQVPPQFRNACLWTNPGDSVLGLEAWSLPIGREEAWEHTTEDGPINRQLYMLEKGEVLKMGRQVAFLRGEALQRELKLVKDATPRMVTYRSNGDLSSF